MVKFDNDYIDKENSRRCKAEKEDVFPSMFTNLKYLKLKRIPLIPDINIHANERVKENVYYLFAYNGYWYISTPSETYRKNGWELTVGWGRIGLGHIDALFEIDSLHSYDQIPLGRLSGIHNPDNDEYEEN